MQTIGRRKKCYRQMAFYIRVSFSDENPYLVKINSRSKRQHHYDFTVTSDETDNTDEIVTEMNSDSSDNQEFSRSSIISFPEDYHLPKLNSHIVSSSQSITSMKLPMLPQAPLQIDDFLAEVQSLPNIPDLFPSSVACNA